MASWNSPFADAAALSSEPSVSPPMDTGTFSPPGISAFGSIDFDSKGSRRSGRDWRGQRSAAEDDDGLFRDGSARPSSGPSPRGGGGRTKKKKEGLVTRTVYSRCSFLPPQAVAMLNPNTSSKSHAWRAEVKKVQQQYYTYSDACGLPWLDRHYLEHSLVEECTFDRLPKLQRLVEVLRQQDKVTDIINDLASEREVLINEKFQKESCVLNSAVECTVSSHAQLLLWIQQHDDLTRQIVSWVLLWRQALTRPLPFMFRGRNYILKIHQDCVGTSPVCRCLHHLESFVSHSRAYKSPFIGKALDDVHGDELESVVLEPEAGQQEGALTKSSRLLASVSSYYLKKHEVARKEKERRAADEVTRMERERQAAAEERFNRQQQRVSVRRANGTGSKLAMEQSMMSRGDNSPGLTNKPGQGSNDVGNIRYNQQSGSAAEGREANLSALRARTRRHSIVHSRRASAAASQPQEEVLGEEAEVVNVGLDGATSLVQSLVQQEGAVIRRNQVLLRSPTKPTSSAGGFEAASELSSIHEASTLQASGVEAKGTSTSSGTFAGQQLQSHQSAPFVTSALADIKRQSLTNNDLGNSGSSVFAATNDTALLRYITPQEQQRLQRGGQSTDHEDHRGLRRRFSRKGSVGTVLGGSQSTDGQRASRQGGHGDRPSGGTQSDTGTPTLHIVNSDASMNLGRSITDSIDPIVVALDESLLAPDTGKSPRRPKPRPKAPTDYLGLNPHGAAATIGGWQETAEKSPRTAAKLTAGNQQRGVPSPRGKTRKRVAGFNDAVGSHDVLVPAGSPHNSPRDQGELGLMRDVIKCESELQEELLLELLQLARMGQYLPVLKFNTTGPQSRVVTHSISNYIWKQKLVRCYLSGVALVRQERALIKSVDLSCVAVDISLFSSRAVHLRYFRIWERFLVRRKELMEGVARIIRERDVGQLRANFMPWMHRAVRVLENVDLALEMRRGVFRELMVRYTYKLYLNSRVEIAARCIRRAVYLHFYNAFLMLALRRRARAQTAGPTKLLLMCNMYREMLNRPSSIHALDTYLSRQVDSQRVQLVLDGEASARVWPTRRRKRFPVIKPISTPISPAVYKITRAGWLIDQRRSLAATEARGRWDIIGAVHKLVEHSADLFYTRLLRCAFEIFWQRAAFGATETDLMELYQQTPADRGQFAFDAAFARDDEAGGASSRASFSSVGSSNHGGTFTGTMLERVDSFSLLFSHRQRAKGLVGGRGVGNGGSEPTSPTSPLLFSFNSNALLRMDSFQWDKVCDTSAGRLGYGHYGRIYNHPIAQYFYEFDRLAFETHLSQTHLSQNNGVFDDAEWVEDHQPATLSAVPDDSELHLSVAPMQGKRRRSMSSLCRVSSRYVPPRTMRQCLVRQLEIDERAAVNALMVAEDLLFEVLVDRLHMESVMMMELQELQTRFHFVDLPVFHNFYSRRVDVLLLRDHSMFMVTRAVHMERESERRALLHSFDFAGVHAFDDLYGVEVGIREPPEPDEDSGAEAEEDAVEGQPSSDSFIRTSIFDTERQDSQGGGYLVSPNRRQTIMLLSSGNSIALDDVPDGSLDSVLLEIV